MKTKFRLFFAAVAVVATLGAAEHKPCCAACAAEGPTAAPAALSTRSLYQLDRTWTNDAGRSVTLAGLRGSPVVVAMFFTHCEYACPVLVSDLQRLRAQLPAAVRAQTKFVLVSFDSVRDSAGELNAFRHRAALDDGWTLLHGDAADVQELAMLLGVKYKEDARGQFSHSNLITVLTKEGEIGYQRAGLMGDVSEAARAVTAAAN